MSEDTTTPATDLMADVPKSMTKEEFDKILKEKQSQAQKRFDSYIANSRKMLSNKTLWKRKNLINHIIDLTVKLAESEYELKRLKEVTGEDETETKA